MSEGFKTNASYNSLLHVLPSTLAASATNIPGGLNHVFHTYSKAVKK